MIRTVVPGSTLLTLALCFAAALGEEGRPPQGGATSPFRIALIGDPSWSAGTLRHNLQAIAAANQQNLEIREIPAKGRPLGDLLASLTQTDQTPSPSTAVWQAVVIFDHPGRLLAQAKPSVLCREMEMLRTLAPRVLWVLSPAPRFTLATEAERLDIIRRAGDFSFLQPLSVLAALRWLQQEKGTRRWPDDLTPERTSSLGDYLTATLIAGALWKINHLPPEVPISGGTTLKIPEDALPLLIELAAQVHDSKFPLPELSWDYAPELAEPVQLGDGNRPFVFEDTGLVPSAFDWQGDSRPDLMISGRGTGGWQIWLTTPQNGLAFTLAEAWKPGAKTPSWDALADKGLTVLQVLDFQRDGQPDFLLALQSGELGMIRRQADGSYSSLQLLKTVQGEPLRIPYLVCAKLGALGKESNWTLVAGNQTGEVVFYHQQGDIANPVWAGPHPLRIEAFNFETEGNAAPAFADWDRDGRIDLIIGASVGSVVWVRNIGQDDQVAWDWPVTLLAACSQDSDLFVPHRKKETSDPWAPMPGWSPFPIATDLNGDHLPDLIVGDTNRRVVKYRELSAEEQAQIQELQARRKALLLKLEEVPPQEQSSLRAALWELTLALLEKSRDRRYERCGWLWYFERKTLAVPRS